MFRRFVFALFCGLGFVAGGRAEEGFFDSNGVKIHYLIEGRGEPVLLIHGFAVNARLQWEVSGVLKALARDHRVIAPDVRGHGQSEKPRDPKKYGTEMVEDVVRLLDRLKIDKAHVVGYSMGALILGKLIASHPDRLLSATLVASSPIPEGGKLPPFFDKLADALDAGKGLESIFQAPTTSGKSKPNKVLLQILNRSLKNGDGKALAAVVRSWNDLGVSAEQLEKNKVPALALIGSNDPLKKAIDEFKNDMANLQVTTIDGANHYTIYLNPKFVPNVRKFVKAHKGAQTKPNRGRKKAG